MSCFRSVFVSDARREGGLVLRSDHPHVILQAREEANNQSFAIETVVDGTRTVLMT